VDFTGGYAPVFGWCSVATDRPPTAVPKQGGYDLHGTPPFIIQTHSTNTSSIVSYSLYTYTDCIYNLTDATDCPGEAQPVPSITGFTASAASICAGQSVTLTANATNAQRYSFDNGITWGASASTVVSPATTTTYTLKVTRTDGGCTVTYPETRTITVRSMPALEFVNPPVALCTNTEAVLTVTDPNNAASSYCFTYECADCVHNPYLTGNDEAAGAGCHWFPECIYGEANTYTVSTYNPGTITVRAKAITDYGCVDSVATTIVAMTVPPDAGCRIWSVGTQFWSEHVRISDCDKTSFTNSNTSPYCRSYEYNDTVYYYYNWSYVNANKNSMCPTPWRVPSVSDFTNLITFLSPSPTINVYYPDTSTWGGVTVGYANGSSMLHLYYGYYWASTESGELAWGLQMSQYSVAVETYERFFGKPLRCVRDVQ
jgi:uncharacterized protein (TIGR02145 family)